MNTSPAPFFLRRRASSRGFTLIDLMVTVAIVAILAAVALPSYTGLVAKGRRAEGRTAALRLLLEQERYFTQTNTYLAIDPALDPSPVFKNFSADSRSSSKYWLGARTCDSQPINQCVEIYAVPQFGKGDPDVGTLTVRSVGSVLGCNGSKPAMCWPS